MMEDKSKEEKYVRIGEIGMEINYALEALQSGGLSREEAFAFFLKSINPAQNNYTPYNPFNYNKPYQNPFYSNLNTSLWSFFD